ncbi:protein TIC 20, chloroplastic-like [Actinidia eriantha]|uniref:protein TIC 20, chloroplastic-like n=1 Tax=Actinidia eriantha TaxID=165200 RepID=UPI00258D0416|nr:protein TIC 20, chloroplastic-like [Actinidia eriantha]
MILSGCSVVSGNVYRNHKESNSKSLLLASTRIPCLPANVSFSCVRSSWRPCQGLKLISSRGSPLLHLGAVSTPLLSGHRGSLSHTIPMLPSQQLPFLTPRASKDDVPTGSFRYPAMTTKPRWWWRVLACVPYLLPFHNTWVYTETAYHLHAFFEVFNIWTKPFLVSLSRLPSWFFFTYVILGHLCVVRRKEWPHFLRFNVAMGLLMDLSLQIVGIVTKRWMPRAIYWGKLGMHFWTFFGFAFLFTVIECVRCTLMGKYADVPFVSDAAYIQIPYE